MRKLPLLMAVVLLSGCAITVNMPVNRFETPETQGDQKFFVEGGTQGSNKVIIVNDITLAALDVESPSFERSNVGAIFGGGFGILPRLDLGIRLLGNAPAQFKAKYQIMGNGRASAAPEQFSLAVSAAVGSSSSSQSRSATSISARSSTDFFTLDGSLIGGYRFNESTLVYSSVFYTNTSVDGSITQTPSNNITTFQGAAIQRGANLGVELSAKKVGLMAELGFGFARYKSATAQQWFGGVVFKIHP